MKRLNFETLNSDGYDIIIIGGGITGASLAHEASLQGLSVALFEMNDFGSATSSATSKLIHGGLRYLKNLEFGLVRESLNERRILGDIAPNLVEPLRFLIPNYKNRTMSNLALKAGMILYDGLSYDKASVQEQKNALSMHKTYSGKETLERAPMIDEVDLSHGTSYFDYANVNPDRMTLAFIKTAVDNRAHVANYTKVTQFIKTHNTIEGVKVWDKIGQKEYTVKADWVVNCSGSWVDEVLELIKPESQSSLLRSEGVHIITKKIQFKDAVVLQTKEGDHLMFIPWRGFTIIGPTDKAYKGDTDHYKPTSDSIDEIIEKINAHIPHHKMGGAFTREDIVYFYGGLRPLLGIDNPDDSYKASRKYEIVDHKKEDGLNGFISVEGGKYTTSRGLAEHTLAFMAKKSNWNVSKVDSTQYPLHACNIENYAFFLKEMNDRFGHQYPTTTIEYYVRNYGLEAQDVLELGLQTSDGKNTITPDGEIMAEIDYAIANEMVFSLDDLLLRRTGVGLVGQPTPTLMNEFAKKLGAHLGWSEADQQHSITTFYIHYITP